MNIIKSKEDIGTRLINSIIEEIREEKSPPFAPMQELWGRVFRLPPDERDNLLRKTAEEHPELFLICRDEIAWHLLVPAQRDFLKEAARSLTGANSVVSAFSLACSPLMDRFSRSLLAEAYGKELQLVLPRFFEMEERTEGESRQGKYSVKTEKRAIGILRACFATPESGRELLPLDEKTLKKLLGIMTSMLRSLEDSDSFERTEALSLCRRFLALHGEHTAPEQKPWKDFFARRDAVEEAEKRRRMSKKMEICI